MPTYVYKFLDTGETIEVQQAFTDDALTEAPHPSDGTVRPVRKVFTPVGITFKGNGFYKTDSRKGSSSSKSSGNGSSSSDSNGSSGASTSSTSTSSDSSSTTSSGSSTTAPSTPAPASAGSPSSS
jgi:predicted nucleic acid-binding Zn ribbon protein